jgi:uracil DNA glycosylase superfamily protein
MYWSNHILKFLSHLQLTIRLPKGVDVMNPYRDPAARKLCEQFYNKYYSDEAARVLILGINPGRFGGGITGIPFTDPLALEKECGIPNTLKKKTELSSEFIYHMIRAHGGPDLFCRRFYISALSPLGFTLDGKNLNYYDNKELEKKVTPFIIESVRAQLGFGIRQDICFCLGEGENFKFLSRLNSNHHFFESIIPLAHPRFIMQYRRKKIADYIADYLVKIGIVNC